MKKAEITIAAHNTAVVAWPESERWACDGEWLSKEEIGQLIDDLDNIYSQLPTPE